MGVLELDHHVLAVGSFEELDEVLRIESDGERLGAVLGLNRVLGFAGFGGRGRDAKFIVLEAHFDGTGTFVGKLRDALDSCLQVHCTNADALVVFFREDGFVIGELASQLPRGEQAGAEAEKERGFILGKLHKLDIRRVEQGKQLNHCLPWDQGLEFARNVEGETFFGYVCQSMSVGSDHGDGLWLQDQQRTIQGVAGFLIRDGEYGFCDQSAKGLRGDFHHTVDWKDWDAGKIRTGHANHFGDRAAGADIDPVIFQQLDADVAIAEEFDVIVKLAGRDGTCAILLDRSRATGAEAEIEVGGRDGQHTVGGLKEKIGQDGDGRLAFDHALGRSEFL